MQPSWIIAFDGRGSAHGSSWSTLRRWTVSCVSLLQNVVRYTDTGRRSPRITERCITSPTPVTILHYQLALAFPNVNIQPRMANDLEECDINSRPSEVRPIICKLCFHIEFLHNGQCWRYPNKINRINAKSEAKLEATFGVNMALDCTRAVTNSGSANSDSSRRCEVRRKEDQGIRLCRLMNWRYFELYVLQILLLPSYGHDEPSLPTRVPGC